MGFNGKRMRKNVDEVEGTFKAPKIQQREVVESALLARMPFLALIKLIKPFLRQKVAYKLKKERSVVSHLD